MNFVKQNGELYHDMHAWAARRDFQPIEVDARPAHWLSRLEHDHSGGALPHPAQNRLGIAAARGPTRAADRVIRLYGSPKIPADQSFRAVPSVIPTRNRACNHQRTAAARPPPPYPRRPVSHDTAAVSGSGIIGSVLGGALSDPLDSILIVDDDREFARKLEAALIECGYRTLVRESGPDALKIVDDMQSTIDLAIIDLVLPGMSGFEVVGAIKRRPNSIKIVVTSLVMRELYMEVAKTFGAHAVLRKPTDFIAEDWIKAIERVLTETRASHAG